MSRNVNASRDDVWGRYWHWLRATILGPSIELENTRDAYLIPLSSRVEQCSQMGFGTRSNTDQLSEMHFYVESATVIEPVSKADRTLNE